jgi:hypothetical protein
LGGANIGKAKAVMDGFGNVGLGEGHSGGTYFLVRKLALSASFVNPNLYSSKKMGAVGLWTDGPWLYSVFQGKEV